MSELEAIQHSLIFMYVIIALLTLCIAVYMVASDPSWRIRRTAARVAFFFWAWPVLLLWPVGRGIKHLWNEADWGKK